MSSYVLSKLGEECILHIDQPYSVVVCKASLKEIRSDWNKGVFTIYGTYQSFTEAIKRAEELVQKGYSQVRILEEIRLNKLVWREPTVEK